jgi:nucleoside-diphosphate-sugar epimerase
MSRVLVPGGAGMVGSRAILGLLAAWREMRTVVGSPTRAAKIPAILEPGNVQPRARVSFIAVEPDHDAERVDVVAGSEFVDDRIRLRE